MLTKQCQNCKLEFTVEDEDLAFYKKIDVPPPTFCPECRLIRRLSWRNERSFHRQECGLCKKPTVMVYPADGNVNPYCNECWWSDKWDALDYGVDFDASKPFLSQFRELLSRVPLPALFGLYPTFIRSEHINMARDMKECYFVTHSDYCENCMYGSTLTHSKDCVDCFIVDQCETCYECVNCKKCYRTLFSVDCEDCYDVYFSQNCAGCNNIFGCVNLKKKQYCIFNEQYTKEEYEEKIKELLPSSRARVEQAIDKLKNLRYRYPTKYMHERHNVNVTGDLIFNSKNSSNIFIGFDLEDSKYCALVSPGGCANAFDFTHYGEKSDLLYESLQVGFVNNVRFSWFALMNSRNVEYCAAVLGAEDSFGCVGVKKKQYCILNKQYTKEQYEKIRAEIVAQMNSKPYIDSAGRQYKYGEFFPSEMSPFSYNEASSQLYFPISQDAAKTNGMRWRDPVEKKYQITFASKDLCDDASFPESVTKEIVGCEHNGKCQDGCTKAFRIVPQEVVFYRKLNLPLPLLCPACRHVERVNKMNKFRLYEKVCECNGASSIKGAYVNTANHLHGADACPNTFQTSYAPESPEIVYCEQCYNAEVV